MNKSTLVSREELSDLDWLARNVHKWKSGYDLAVVQRGGGEIYVTWPSVCSSGITKKQWITRRAELQNKPSWSDAPEWAEWLAQDEDGEWKWLAGLPGKYVDCWTAVKIKGCCKGITLGDWWDTLEKRPEQDEFEPFVSIEDNQEKDMKRDDGWFEREDLPPVGVKCETLVEPELQWVSAEVVAHRDGFAIVWITNEKCGAQSDAPKHFRPIRSERDMLIEMLADFDGSPASAKAVADAILAAGFSMGAK